MGETRSKRKFLSPEVVQTSAMDCGPAALKCLLEGFGVPVSYGRLREACQTDVDGTSIDTLEEIAVQLGLDAEQVMIPADHLLLPEADGLPAIVVVRHGSGSNHFVLLWRVAGPLVQIMDPATGRRWMKRETFLRDLYLHRMPVPAEAWRGYAEQSEFLGPLRRRLSELGVSGKGGEELIAEALRDPTWRGLGTLDAALRMASAIERAGGITRGEESSRVLGSFFTAALADTDGAAGSIPDDYWSVRPAPAADESGEEMVEMRGAVLVRVAGIRKPSAETGEEKTTTPPLSRDLAYALEEKSPHPVRTLLALLSDEGAFTPLALLAAMIVSAAGVVLEALLFRGLFDIGRNLMVVEQRALAIASFGIFLLLLLLIDLPIASTLLRLGRSLEVRLRLAFLEKLPLLGDRYLQSRPISDMAERGHILHQLRLLPELGGTFVKTLLQLLLTCVGLVWLDPSSALTVILGTILVVGIPLLAQPLLSEQDLRARTHIGALGRFYLDALLGLMAIRTHSADRPVRREHEGLLVEWAKASRALQRTVVIVEALQGVIGPALAGWLIFHHAGGSVETGGILLQAYWALQLPALGQMVALLARQYPAHRNVVLRLLEPLGAPSEGSEEHTTQVPKNEKGMSIDLRDGRVVAAGHTILSDVNLSIPSGSHVAIVGRSGAGKSSLVGLLLGWHRLSQGSLLIDDVPFDGSSIAQLREQIAWIDPSVHLWNRSLMENLCYGSGDDLSGSLGDAIADADLREVLARLPEGLHSSLGEGGGLVSGGEGQRVRLGRAILRRDVRLVIMDEPFRGLDRGKRQVMLDRVRDIWKDATILCVTHDVGQTEGFPRVLVVDAGAIVEDGPPEQLGAVEGSLYRKLLDDEDLVRRDIWSGPGWRKIWLRNGLVEEIDD